MEAVDYVLGVKARWLMIVALVIIGAVNGWLTTPHAPTSAAAQVSTSYAATNVMTMQPFVSSVSSAGSPLSLRQIALLASAGEVSKRAAQQIHFSGNPAELASEVQVGVDEKSSSLSLTAVDSTGARATDVANAFADQLMAYLVQLQQASQQQAVAATSATLATLKGQITQLDAQLPSDPKATLAPGQELLRAQKDALVVLYGQQYQRSQLLAAAPAPTSPIVSVRPAVPVPAAQSPALAAQAAGGSGKTTSATALSQATATPTPPARSSSSSGLRNSRPLHTGLGALVGLLIGLGVALGLERLAPKVRTRAAVEAAFDYPVIAEIPYGRPRRRHPFETVAAVRPSSTLADAYRGLRTALLHGALQREVTSSGEGGRDVLAGGNHAPNPPLGLVLVTSPWSGEGKTTVVANLSASLAESGRSVGAVSADLRRPLLHRYLGAAETPGLTDVLTNGGSDGVEAGLQETAVPGVVLMSSGTPMQNEVALLSLAATEVRGLCDLFDVVVVDTPGLFVASDVTEFLPDASGVLLTCRLGVTPRKRALRAADELRRLGAPVLGVVLVGTAPRRRVSRWHGRTTRKSPKFATAPAQAPAPAPRHVAGAAPRPRSVVQGEVTSATFSSSSSAVVDTDPPSSTFLSEGENGRGGSNGSTRWEREPSATWRETPVGVVVLPANASVPFSLAGSGAALWEALEQPSTLDELSHTLAARYGAPADDVADDLRPVLDELVRRSLLRRSP